MTLMRGFWLNSILMRCSRPQSIPEVRSPCATIDGTAQLGRNVIIDPHAVIGRNARIGAGSVIAANAVGGPSVLIGENASISPYSSVIHAAIGARVIISHGRPDQTRQFWVRRDRAWPHQGRPVKEGHYLR
jgi:UDP-3-O-[3-hydroxymyristoyl] glucosamine N-acyltransferase